MYCPNCGKQVEDGDKFCRSCGANLESQTPQKSQVEKKADGKKIASILIAVAMILLCFADFDSPIKPFLAVMGGLFLLAAIIKA